MYLKIYKSSSDNMQLFSKSMRHLFSSPFHYYVAYIALTSFHNFLHWHPLGSWVVWWLRCSPAVLEVQGSIPGWRTLNFLLTYISKDPSWISFRREVELVIPCISVYAWQVKDPTHEINVNSLSIITSSNSINLWALLSGKIGLSTIPAW